ncbi:uncharacterized protein LOC105167560 [Sesamum indicum]|uniref:Uncharacterized protein LOC105167560 n=1 Tax=Sesamum indicum TaxID=4182 RepID=A0A6I9TIW7_SESIN|nr:uncharacterized protein LOC105167560 [Sesamum indicum]
MFDLLFGWRKASKCKKLMKTVQCRLKLLKNKRSCIVKQLREDAAELLKHGLHQTAFERVEQLVKDERTFQVYELLEHFCEFIMINLPYIRKHKDCPNDINEAASTLIFSSARFGELPELLAIRKLFGERYGQRFVTSALELLPGNLVNHQVKESVCAEMVTDDVKYRLLDEIASSCAKTGPLLLEYKPQLQEEQAIKGSGQMPSSEIQICTENQAPEPQRCIGRELEGKIMYMDFSPESKKVSKEPCFGLGKEHSSLDTIQDSEPGDGEKLVNSVEMDKFTVPRHESLQCTNTAETPAFAREVETSSITSAQLPEETVYLDDIEEFVPPVSKDGSLQDQRLFMFKSFGIPLKEKTNYGIDINLEEEKLPQERSFSRSSRKMRKASRKRSRRRRSVSVENRNITDVESVIYYGESDEMSPDHNKRKSHHQKKRKDKILVRESRKSYHALRNQGHTCFVKVSSSFSLIDTRENNMEFSCSCNSSQNITKECSLGHPCYFSPHWRPKMRSSNMKDFTTHSLKEGNVQYGLLVSKYSNRGEGEKNSSGEEIRPHALRAMTMPAERAKESLMENVFRSNSFPSEQPHSRHSSCHHIHPKLPDYDELAAKFMELKRANLQNK